MGKFVIFTIIAFTSVLMAVGCSTVKAPNSLSLKGFPGSFKPGQIIDCHRGQPVSYQELIASLAGAKAIYVGETHLSIQDHQIERKIIQGVYQRTSSVVIAMEMFPEEVQGTLNQWLKGSITEQEFLSKVNWKKVWGYPFRFYRPILYWAKEHQVQVLAINAPPEVVGRIARNGISSLSPAERRQIASKLDFTNNAEKKFLRKQYKRHPQDEIKSFDTFYQAHLAWDETMAENVAKALSRHPGSERFIVLAGKGHIVYKFGIPQRTFKRIKHSFLTVVPLSTAEVDGPVDPAIADYVWVTEKEDFMKHHPHVLGIMIKQRSSGKGLQILQVLKDTPADRAQMKKGDILLKIDNVEINSLEDVHRAMQTAKKIHRVTVRRGKKTAQLTVKIEH